MIRHITLVENNNPLLYTGAMMQDLTVDQHSTQMDQYSTNLTEATW